MLHVLLMLHVTGCAAEVTSLDPDPNPETVFPSEAG